MTRGRLALVGGAFAAYLALAVLATHPLALHATDHVIGSPTPPGEATPPLNIWAMDVVLEKLPRDPLRLFDGNAFYPYRQSLAFSEHLFVPALAAAPVVGLTGNWVLAYNVVLLGTLAAAGLGMFLFARAVCGDGAAAVAAGILYAFHTWNQNELVRSQITANAFFPFVLLALLRYFERPGPRRAAAAGLFYLLQSLSCMYWALYLPFLVASMGAWLWWRRRPPWRALLPLAVATGGAMAVTGLFAIPYLQTARELGFERPVPLSVAMDRYFDVLPENWLYAGLLGRALRNQNAAHFLGFVPLALGLVGAVAARGPGGAALLRPLFLAWVLGGFVLSLGPELILGDRVLAPGPYGLLWELVPGFRNVRYPERLSIVLVLGLSPLVAAGLARLRPRLGTAGLLAVSAVVFLEHLSIPQSLSWLPGGRRVPEVYRWLASRPDVGAVAEVPASRMWMERADAMPMYYAAVHGKPSVLGYTSYFPPTYRFTKWRLFHFPARESVAFLERFGVDTVVVAPGPEGPPSWALEDAPSWTRTGPFPEGHVVLRLRGARGQRYGPPPEDSSAFVEIDRASWDVQASHEEARRALDGDPSTVWSTGGPQSQGDFYRVRLGSPSRVARIVASLAPPFCFPMRLKLVGEVGPGQWVEVPFDGEAAYDRLFETLLHRPRDAAFVVDLGEPRELTGLRLRITDTDPFWMPWELAEIRLYERR